MTIDKETTREASGFKVLKSHASIDQTETVIYENQATLNYVTPHFRVDAEVEVPPLKDGEVYTVGWVQAVTAMKFYNFYPMGQSSWELPDLNNHRTTAVSDADGRQYPWYGVTTECSTIQGPCKPLVVKLSMNDNFSPTVSWAVPVGKDQPDSLQKVERDQSFTVWLVVKNELKGTYKVLKGYKWRAMINIAVDCSLPQGMRAKLLEPKMQKQPEEIKDLSIPNTALQSPRANEAQKFVWRTKDTEIVFEVACTPRFCLHMLPEYAHKYHRYTPYPMK